jgi:hypothetical protein
MKKTFLINIFSLCAICGLAAQNITVSGILDSSVSLRAGAGDAPAFSYGVEEFANLRMKANVRDRAAVFGAVNFIAVAGDYAADAALMADVASANTHGMSPTAFAAGENYIAGFELERLYFRLDGEVMGFDGGLLRLPFGYGQVWGPSDFLNPKNPLKPDARPRAVLGAGLSWYPVDSLKLLGFGAAPRDPFSRSGEGGLFGFSLDQHWNKVSVQPLYSFESPNDGSRYGIHRIGLSVKANVEVALLVDALYTYNHEAGTGIDGLSFSMGADYSFFAGDLLVLVEYLYSGDTSSTALGYGGSFSHNNYLYTGAVWRFNDFTNINIALISGFDDISFTPVLTLNHDLFQGATLIVSAQIPLDRDLFSADGRRGELGPLPPDELQPLLPVTGERIGRYFDCSVKLRLRF